MFTIKNAIKNIYRYKSKYILFGVLYLIVILAASVCATIFFQMGNVTDTIIKEYAGIAKYDGRNYFDNLPRFTKDEFMQLNDMDHIEDVRFFRYNFHIVYQKILEEIPSIQDIKNYPQALKTEISFDGNAGLSGFEIEPILILGYNLSLMHLATDNFDLEKGRMFENGGEAVIAKNRLDPNIGRWDEDSEAYIESEVWKDLDLNDKIIFKNAEGIYKEFTVVGILAQNPSDDRNTKRNVIYTTFESAEYFDVIADEKRESKPVTSRTDLVYDENREFANMGYEALFYLNSPDNFLVLREKMSEKGISIEPFFPNFNAISSLTQNMQAWSVTFMILTGFIIICVTIISTIILLNGRKYEMAVLRSAGMKKSKLIINYLIENLAFIWGISVISLIAAQFVSKIFTADIFAGIEDLVGPEILKQLTQGVNIELVLQNIGLVFAGTTAVVMLSLILACINIIRFQPLKIFNKQY